MPSTPTTEGSIVAYLRLDSSDWDAKLDEAKAKAEELGRLNPTITVHADVADAISKMEAAQLAADEMRGDKTLNVTARVSGPSDWRSQVDGLIGGASDAQAAAAAGAASGADDLAASEGRAATATESAARWAQFAADAQQRLDEMQASSTASARALEDAQAAVARTQAKADAAAAEAARLQGELTAQRRAAVDAARAQAAAEGDLESAQRRAAEAEKALTAARNNNNGGGGAGYFGVVAGVVAALVPVMGSLAGYIAGVGGAFAGMGAAGVLAMEGIKNAIADSTAMGQQFAGGLDVLKADLNGLEGASAGAMLGPFQEMVQTINGAMPQLSDEIAGFSAQLGDAGNAVLHGLVTGFRVLNPLFTEAGVYIDAIAHGFERWTSDGGLQKFASFALQALPQVADALGSLAKLALNLVDALAPLGSVALSAVTDLATALDGLPLPVLGGVAAAATAAFFAFRSWAGLSPIVSKLTEKIGSLRGGTQALTGLKFAGWAVAGAAAAYALSSAVAAAVESFSGVPSELTRINNAIASGNPKAASASYRDLATQMDFLKTKMGGLMSASVGFASWLHANKLDFLTLGMDKQVTDIIDGMSNYKAAVKAADAAQAGATETTNGTVVALGKESSAAVTAQTDITALSTALSKMGGTNLSASQANIQYQTSMANAEASVKQYGKQLDLTTAAGRANQTALDGIASSAIALVSANAANNDSEKSVMGTMANARASFIAVAEQMGYSATAAQNLADKDGLIPANVSTLYKTSGAAQAIANANAVAAAVNSIPVSKQVSIFYHDYGMPGVSAPGIGVLAGHSAGGRTGHAAGGVVTGPGNAFSDTAGDYYPVSNGEWIVSNMGGQASKWDKVLAAVNQNSPASTVAALALGVAGVTGVPQVQGAPRVVNNWTVNITTDNPELMYQYLAQKQNQFAAV